MLIESKDNKKIKEIIKLKQKKYRDETNKYLIETPHLINEAYKNNSLESIFYLPSCNLNLDVPSYEITPQIMQKITSLENSKVVGVCKIKKQETIKGNKILLLDNIQDPGNLGTIIRSALAFNIDTIILSNDSCDLYNFKTLRGAEGANFYLNIIREDLKEAITYLKSKKITIYATVVDGGIKPVSIKEKKYALLIGNEGNGLKEEFKKEADQRICIETNNKLESLNVAVATSIILYELNK